MKPPDLCPDPARLRALLGGELDATGELMVVDHLDHCPACRTLLDRWSADSDPLGGLTARAGPPRSPALERILEGLKAFPPGRDPAPPGRGQRSSTGRRPGRRRRPSAVASALTS